MHLNKWLNEQHSYLTTHQSSLTLNLASYLFFYIMFMFLTKTNNEENQIQSVHISKSNLNNYSFINDKKLIILDSTVKLPIWVLIGNYNELRLIFYMSKKFI